VVSKLPVVDTEVDPPQPNSRPIRLRIVSPLVIDEEPIFWAFVIVHERYSKEAELKFIDVVTTQTSTTSEPMLRVKPYSYWLCAQ